jgi:hypothetical protein
MLSNIAYDNYIIFLSQFDYVDLHNLCKIDHDNENICEDDEILKSILMKNLGLKLPNMIIAQPLHNLYNSLFSLINELYPEENFFGFKFPRWINKEQFKDDMARKIYKQLKYNLWEDLFNYDINYKNNKELKFKLSIDTLILYKPDIVFPFHALNTEYEFTDTSIDKHEYLNDYNNKLKLSYDTIHYIEDMIQYIFDRKGYGVFIEKAIEPILFIK